MPKKSKKKKKQIGKVTGTHEKSRRKMTKKEREVSDKRQAFWPSNQGA